MNPVLRKLAFGRIQGLIDQRRDRIREALSISGSSLDFAIAALGAPYLAIASAFFGVVQAVFYFDLRVRREGFDLEQRVDALAAGAGAWAGRGGWWGGGPWNADLVGLPVVLPRRTMVYLRPPPNLVGWWASAPGPRLIGYGRAAELLYTGRVMTANEGLAWGFFNRLVPRDAVFTQALSLAAEIAQGPTLAHAMTKRMLHAEWHLPIDAAIDAEAEAQAQCMQTEDFRRAYRAFVAKQKPQFEGN